MPATARNIIFFESTPPTKAVIIITPNMKIALELPPGSTSTVMVRMGTKT